MSYKINNPVDMVAHLPSIIEQEPTHGAWYLFWINDRFHIQGWAEYGKLEDALLASVEGREGVSSPIIPAIVRWGGIQEDSEAFVEESRTAVKRLVVDCLQVYDVMHGTARASSMLCLNEECGFCGSLIPVDPAPGQPYAGLPLAVGDMEFGIWQGSYRAAEELVLGLLEKVEMPYGAEFFDQDELPQLAALLSYRGGRDYVLSKCAEQGAFPNMALRMIMDHGAPDSPSVQNAACVMAGAYLPLSKTASAALVEWVLQTDPGHRLAHLMKRMHEKDDAISDMWFRTLKKHADEDSYRHQLPEGATI